METVVFRPPDVWDEDGNITPVVGEEVAATATVSPYSLGDVKAADYDATTSLLQVLVEPAPRVVPQAGWVCVVRGVEYTVVRAPWQWSVGRAAWNPRHRPRLAVIVSRGESFE
ncbi:hypothetical protein C1Y63_10575 [Corynebacterium sp. 13CS0277]|nr:hypothetical protein C1Y63_10575 [Corynebacterium sp. 13CS0277]